MANGTVMMPVDPDKVRAWCNEHNFSMAKLGREMGYSDSAVSYCLNRKRAMSKPMLKGMEALTGLTYDDLKPAEKPKEPAQTAVEPETPAQTPAVSQETLTNAIHRAISSILAQYGDERGQDAIISMVAEGVFQGISKAVGRYKKELMCDVRGSVFSAVYQAHDKLIKDTKNGEVSNDWQKQA